jgi:hypothetical protein
MVVLAEAVIGKKVKIFRKTIGIRALSFAEAHLVVRRAQRIMRECRRLAKGVPNAIAFFGLNGGFASLLAESVSRLGVNADAAATGFFSSVGNFARQLVNSAKLLFGVGGAPVELIRFARELERFVVRFDTSVGLSKEARFVSLESREARDSTIQLLRDYVREAMLGKAKSGFDQAKAKAETVPETVQPSNPEDEGESGSDETGSDGEGTETNTETNTETALVQQAQADYVQSRKDHKRAVQARDKAQKRLSELRGLGEFAVSKATLDAAEAEANSANSRVEEALQATNAAKASLEQVKAKSGQETKLSTGSEESGLTGGGKSGNVSGHDTGNEQSRQSNGGIQRGLPPNEGAVGGTGAGVVGTGRGSKETRVAPNPPGASGEIGIVDGRGTVSLESAQRIFDRGRKIYLQAFGTLAGGIPGRLRTGMPGAGLGFLPVVGAIGQSGGTFSFEGRETALPLLDEGAEARVFEGGDGSVIKVYPLLPVDGAGAFTFGVSTNGKLIAQSSNSYLDVIEKALVINAIGGVPSDVLGKTAAGELVVRQPKGWTGRMSLKERYRVNKRAGLVWIPPDVLPVEGYSDSLYLSNIEGVGSFIVGDLHEDNYLRNSRQQGRILDLITLRVTPELEKDFPQLREFIDENPVKSRGPIAFSTGAEEVAERAGEIGHALAMKSLTEGAAQMRWDMVAGGLQLDEVGRLLHTMDLPEGWSSDGWVIDDNGFVARFHDGEGNSRRIGIFANHILDTNGFVSQKSQNLRDNGALFPQNGENWNNGGANSNQLEYSTGVERWDEPEYDDSPSYDEYSKHEKKKANDEKYFEEMEKRFVAQFEETQAIAAKELASLFFSRDEAGAAKPPAFFTDSAKKQYKAVWWEHHNKDKTGKDSWLKAPNGKDTKLTPALWTIVRMPNFKNKFGDWENDPANATKVLDENGEPLVVFHGSKTAGFDSFRIGGERDKAVFTSDTRKVAADYTGFPETDRETAFGDEADYDGEGWSGVYSLFLDVRNPAVFDFKGNGYFDYPAVPVVDRRWWLVGVFETREEAEAAIAKNEGWRVAPVQISTDLLVNFVKRQNLAAGEGEKKDGVFFRNIEDGGHVISNVYVGFKHPKSAVRNNGEFSEKTQIQFSTGGEEAEVSPTLAADIEAALNVDRETGTVERASKIVHFSNTPARLRFAGMPDANIVSDAARIRKMKNQHRLTEEQIAAFPQEYSAPVAVLREGDGFLVITSMLADNGEGLQKPVMIFLRPDLPNNFVASAYSPDAKREAHILQSFTNGKGVLYLDAKKAASLVGGTQFPIRTKSGAAFKGEEEFQKWRESQAQYSTGAEDVDNIVHVEGGKISDMAHAVDKVEETLQRLSTGEEVPAEIPADKVSGEATETAVSPDADGKLASLYSAARAAWAAREAAREALDDARRSFTPDSAIAFGRSFANLSASARCLCARRTTRCASAKSNVRLLEAFA